MSTSFKAKLAQFSPERQARIKSEADRFVAALLDPPDVNDEMLAEAFRLGLRVQSAHHLRCDSLGFILGE